MDPVNFAEQSSEAASAEMTTSRRTEEAKAAYEADQARLKAAAEAAKGQENTDKTGDDITNTDGGDSFIIFY